MVVVTAIAVPYDGISGVRNTVPFSFPFSAILTTITDIEPRCYGITEHNRVLFDDFFANEGRVVLGQFRYDAQRQVDG